MKVPGWQQSGLANTMHAESEPFTLRLSISSDHSWSPFTLQPSDKSRHSRMFMYDVVM